MDFETDPDIIDELRALRATGARSAVLLHRLADDGFGTIAMMEHFRVAFGLDAFGVGPIGGWRADGTGELDDDAVSNLIDPLIA